MKECRVFYFFAGVGEVPSDQPRRMSLTEVHARLFAKLKADGDFLGLVDPEEVTLQFLRVEEPDGIWVETPRPAEKGSLGRWMRRDDVEKLLLSLPDRFESLNYTGFEFKPWTHEEE